jgi:hypothetical protein
VVLIALSLAKCDNTLRRNTEGFTHAVQIELSLRLRKHLNDNKADRDAFARAMISSVVELTVPSSL